MSRASERDLVARSLGGDFKSRVQLYEFVSGNSRVRRLGGRYPNADGFLHDCFANLLRASHASTGDTSLRDQVESVAAWTALERDRMRGMVAAGAAQPIRMCAAIEGDGPGNRLASYVPPRLGPQDSLHSRISAVIGEVPFTLIRTHAMENSTWEDIAEAAGKPVNTIGPILVRSVDRLARFFGAPPPLNEDFEPVFSEVCAREARLRHANPEKPTGRVISMQLDPAFYSVTSELRNVGLSIPSEVRTIVLWDAARAPHPPGEALRGHLAGCRYCTEVLRSFLLIHQAVCSAADAEFLLCPGASTLLLDSDDAEDAFHGHLDACAACRSERSLALGGPKWGKRIAWAAASVILGGVLFAALRHPTWHPPAAFSSETVPATPEVALSPKYQALAQAISIDDQKFVTSILPRDQLAVMEAVKEFKRRDLLAAKMMSEQIANEFNDPGARMLFAVCLYGQQRIGDGYREMQRAEAMPPRNSFRCWALLQCALLVGDQAIAEREVTHLSADPEYGVRARNILARMRAIK